MTTILEPSNRDVSPEASPFEVNGAQFLHALPHPVFAVGPQGDILDANAACEMFFDTSRAMLRRHKLADLLPFGSPLLSLVQDQLSALAAAPGGGVPSAALSSALPAAARRAVLAELGAAAGAAAGRDGGASSPVRERER